MTRKEFLKAVCSKGKPQRLAEGGEAKGTSGVNWWGAGSDMWKGGEGGANMGSSYGPWGALIGGIAGHLMGGGSSIAGQASGASTNDATSGDFFHNFLDFALADKKTGLGSMFNKNFGVFGKQTREEVQGRDPVANQAEGSNATGPGIDIYNDIKSPYERGYLQRFALGGNVQMVPSAQPAAPAPAPAPAPTGPTPYDTMDTSRNAYTEADRGMADNTVALKDMAEGRGPSLATELLRQNNEANAARAMGLASSMRGGNPSAYAKQAQAQQAAMANQAAAQGAQARLQEQVLARNMLSQQLGQRATAGQGMYGTTGTLQLGQDQLSQKAKEAEANWVLNKANADWGRAIQMAAANNAGESAAQAQDSVMGGGGGVLGGIGKLLGLPFAEGGEVPAKAPEAPKVESTDSNGSSIMDKWGPVANLIGGMIANNYMQQARDKDWNQGDPNYDPRHGWGPEYLPQVKPSNAAQARSQMGNMVGNIQTVMKLIPMLKNLFGSGGGGGGVGGGAGAGGDGGTWGADYSTDMGGGGNGGQDGITFNAGPGEGYDPSAGAYSDYMEPGYSHGGQVNGRAVFGGDDLRNDTQHALLSPGEIVIPRSITHDNDPEAAANQAKGFVQALIASRRGR